MKNYIKHHPRVPGELRPPPVVMFFDDAKQESFRAAVTAMRARFPSEHHFAVWRRFSWMSADVRCIGHAPVRSDGSIEKGYRWKCATCGQSGWTKGEVQASEPAEGEAA